MKKLTIVWIWAGCFLFIWALGATFIYHLQFMTTGKSSGMGTSAEQDAAGYLGFFGASALAVIIGAIFTIKIKRFPHYEWNSQGFLRANLWGVFVFLPFYVVVLIMYEWHKKSMPYDANWAEIGGISLIGLAHYVFVTLLTLLNWVGSPNKAPSWTP